MLPLSESEIREIKAYIKKNNIKEQRNILVNAIADMTCPFMKKSNTDKKCVIYEIRPKICRYFICSDPKGAAKHPDMYQERRLLVNVKIHFWMQHKRT